jgi:N-acetylglutamate synthase
MVTAIEEYSMNAWPALQTMLYDGWIIRFADGYTKRANSVQPLYHSSIDLDEKLHFCENAYQNKQLPTVFKITPATYPIELDERLMSRGYRQDSPTSVQIVELEAKNPQFASQVSGRDSLSNEWLDSCCRLNAIVDEQRPRLQRILLSIVPRHFFVSLKLDGHVIACGLGVLQGESLGLFDIVTESSLRGRGFGHKILESILSWGKRHGARRAYLQVMLNNAAALHLYSTIGFVEQYQYWYRIQS